MLQLNLLLFYLARAIQVFIVSILFFIAGNTVLISILHLFLAPGDREASDFIIYYNLFFCCRLNLYVFEEIAVNLAKKSGYFLLQQYVLFKKKIKNIFFKFQICQTHQRRLFVEGTKQLIQNAVQPLQRTFVLKRYLSNLKGSDQ